MDDSFSLSPQKKSINKKIKNCVVILTIHLLRCFFHYSKQFLKSLILMPFSASAVCVSLLPHQQNVSL